MIEQRQKPLRIDVALMCESIWESAGFCYGGSPIFLYCKPGKHGEKT